MQASVGGGSAKALIVDSVSAVLSSMLGGKQNEGIVLHISYYLSANRKPSYFASGMSLLMQVAGELKMIAKDFNIAVLVNNVTFLV